MRKLFHNFTYALDGERQSMLVENGRVVERGPRLDVADAGRIDLKGAYLLPGFVDAHCHILPTGLDLKKLQLEGCSTPDEVLDALRDALPSARSKGWLAAVHYDHNRFSERRHLTRDDLDRISEDIPILIRHVSGHASVANTAALRAAGIGEDSPDPAGGAFRRDETGRIDGVLLEIASEIVSAAEPAVSFDEMVAAVLAASEKMSEFGITCASDMMTARDDQGDDVEVYRAASRAGCRIRSRLYLHWGDVFGPRAAPAPGPDPDPDRCRIVGVKIFSDGAIGSATAAIYGEYAGQATSGRGLSRNSKSAAANAPVGAIVSGQLIYSPQKLAEMVRIGAEAGYQVAVHAIGDYAVDLVMDAYEPLANASRHRIEHAMLLSDAQIERMARLGCHCTMQPEFLIRFGAIYPKQLGAARASSIKRMRSITDAGIRLSLNSDRPIVSGDPWVGIRAAVARPEGYDPAESLTLREAIRGYTVGGALANEDLDMGTLDAGSHADFQLYAQDPLSLGAGARPHAVFVGGENVSRTLSGTGSRGGASL